MSANESPEEIRRQMWRRFDAGNVEEEIMRRTRHDARTREVREENERRLRRDTDTDITQIASDLSDTGDMAENDSSAG